MEQTEDPGLRRTGFTAHCPHCRTQSTFIRARLANHRHLLLTILTLGLWSVVWFILFLGKSLRPWRCQHCGWHKPEFRKPPRASTP
jgi:hypothetical protein